MKKTEIYYPKNQIAWRRWLAAIHLSKEAIGLVFYKKSANNKTISWGEPVDVVLCYGWIDIKKIKIDEETKHQYFCKRKVLGQKIIKKSTNSHK